MHAKRKQTEGKKQAQRARTARNKVRAIERNLKTAGGQQVAKLKERLTLWMAGGRKA